MTEEPNLEFEGKGLSLRVKGSKPISQVSQYAADAIGIIGEPLGILKDKLAAFRLNQAEASAIAMQRARDIKNEHNEPTERVSQKYLASWIEGSSNEDVSAENILEIWARLLANAGPEFDARFLAYNDALRKIGPQEAKIIDKFIQPRFISGLSSAGQSEMYRWCTPENCEANVLEVSDYYFSLIQNNQAPVTCHGTLIQL
tara:strand:+ start:90 stop:692 length:603 start_codon:yes stop_codon:yes gene_type:complete